MINLILAVDDNGCIWKNNSLCWNEKEDLKFFSEKTKWNVVIMWKNTYLSLPEKFRPLPDRKNIVVSRTLKDDKVEIVNDLESAIKLAKTYDKEIFVIGWKSMYELWINIADRVYLTRVIWTYDCDICLSSWFFIKLLDNFKLENIVKKENLEFREYIILKK